MSKELNKKTMKAKEIQDLINFIKESGMDEVNIETDQFKLSVKKNSEVQQVAPVIAAPAPVATPAPAPAIAAQPTAPPAAPASNEGSASGAGDESKYVAVKAPMIGTFYRSANPESDPFVNVGDKIDKGNTVCIIEAMKLFNEIESEVSGTIVKVVADDATPVEFGQTLFLVDPS